jgi:integrase
VTVPELEYQAVLMYADPVLAFALKVIANTGLRIGTVCRLAPMHVSNGMIAISTKCAEFTQIAVTESLAALLIGMSEVCTDNAAPFLLHFGVKHSFQLARRLRAAQLKVGCSKQWTFHDIRRTFARRLYAQTHDLLKVQSMMAHRRPDYTLHYLVDPDNRPSVDELTRASLKGVNHEE